MGLGVPFRGPYNKDYSILGSILGPLVLGNCQMGSCQNYGPFLDPYDNTAPNIDILRVPKKGTMILTTTHV